MCSPAVKKFKLPIWTVLSRSSYGHLNAEWKWFCVLACFLEEHEIDKTLFPVKTFPLPDMLHNICSEIKFTVSISLVF